MWEVHDEHNYSQRCWVVMHPFISQVMLFPTFARFPRWASSLDAQCGPAFSKCPESWSNDIMQTGNYTTCVFVSKYLTSENLIHTLPETNSSHFKNDGFQVRNLQTSRGPPFSGDMLVSGRVSCCYLMASRLGWYPKRRQTWLEIASGLQQYHFPKYQQYSCIVSLGIQSYSQMIGVLNHLLSFMF